VSAAPGKHGQSIDGETEVTRLIEQEISTGRLPPGSRLPTERAWVERSGQSRTTVRRSLAALEARGRIVRHVGRGTFVASSPPDDHDESDADGASSPVEIMAVRLLIEPSSMPLIVTAAKRADLIEIQRCLVGGEQNQDYESFEHWDTAFHRALALATHNSLLVRMCDMTNHARHQPLWGQLKRKSFTPERCREYIEDHRNITTALAERDAILAQEAMQTHLLRVRRYVLGRSYGASDG